MKKVANLSTWAVATALVVVMVALSGPAVRAQDAQVSRQEVEEACKLAARTVEDRVDGPYFPDLEYIIELGPGAVPHIIAMLEDARKARKAQESPRPDLSLIAAMDALAFLRDPRSVPYLKECVKCGEIVNWWAVEVLAKMGERSVLQTIRDRGAERLASQETLAMLGDEQALAYYRERARTESHAYLLEIICIGGDPSAYKLVQDAIPKKPDAAKLLVYFAKDRPVVPILIDGLSQKENPLLRIACAYGLGELCERSAVPLLVEMATEPTKGWSIPHSAVRALAKILSGGRIRDEVDMSLPGAQFIRMSRDVPIEISEAFDAIVRSLEANPSAKPDVIAALGAIRGERACCELMKIMKNEVSDPVTRWQCARQLAKIGDAAARGALLEALPRSKGQEKAKICVALGRIADKSDRTTLQEIADKDEDSTVREAAKAAIEDMGFRQELRKKGEEGK